jgi:hypothetical protein
MYGILAAAERQMDFGRNYSQPGAGAKTPNSKHQAPEKFQASSTQKGQRPRLEFGNWTFSGVWSLVFGVSEARGCYKIITIKDKHQKIKIKITIKIKKTRTDV